ncbi:MAG: aryl-sulfate sulfotransferase [Myxococcales bacterium]|nr:aryl-sulfate sulfotransferase [Myxococcales bacterium]
MAHGESGRPRGAWAWISFLAASAVMVGCPPPGLSLTDVTPSPAAPGDIITLTGGAFGANQGASAVLYDGSPLPIFSWSDTQILAALPNPKPSGFYDVAVQVGGVTSNSVEHRICPTAGCPFEVHHVTYTVNPQNILGGFVDFHTDVPAVPSVSVDGPEGSFTVPLTGILSASPGTSHHVGVLGLRQATSYTIRVKATDPGTLDETPEVAVPHTTGSVDPDKFPLMLLTVDPVRMQSGYTFFRASSPTASGGFSRLYALDGEGQLVWYDESGAAPEEVFRLANGNLLYNTAGNSVEEIDMFGDTIRTITNVSMGTDTIHHELTPLPNGNYLTLSTELRTIGGYPLGLTFDVVGDVIVEFTSDGVVVDEWSTFDHLDPYRIHFGWDSETWWSTYHPFVKDWTHGNGVIYDASDDTMIVSLRHQDIVYKLTRAHPEQLVWVMGQDEPATTGDDAWPFLTLVGPGKYPNHQHAPELLPNGHILMYDNANNVQITRAVEYAIDPGALTMTQEWEWVDPDYTPPLFARFVGDVDLQPNGNVLIFDGGLERQPDLTNPISLRISEVTRDTSEKVFEAWMYAEDLAYVGYRAVRLPTLYPPEP